MIRRLRREEGGSALVETAIVLSLLMVLAVGAFEWGMAFRDWLSVSSATREGARVAASAGRIAPADCAILEATAGSLLSIDGSRIRFVDIYVADSTGAPPARCQTYQPFDAATDDPSNLRCNNWFAVNDTCLPPLGPGQHRSRARLGRSPPGIHPYLENRAVLVVGRGHLERSHHHSDGARSDYLAGSHRPA